MHTYSTYAQGALFVFFILTRALHPLLIDASKTDGSQHYIHRYVGMYIHRYIYIYIYMYMYIM